MKMNHGERIDYFVNEEKRTVVAVLRVPAGIMGTEMLRMMQKESGGYFGIDDCMLGKAMVLKGRYEGKAVCHDDDEWDVEKGMHLAKLRALRLYLKDRRRIAELTTEVFIRTLDRIKNAEDYCFYAQKRIDAAIEELED